MPHGITQCYLPPGRGDIPALTPVEAGTRFSNPGGMQGWVDLGRRKGMEGKKCKGWKTIPLFPPETNFWLWPSLQASQLPNPCL